MPSRNAFITYIWTQIKILELGLRFGCHLVARMYRLQLPEVDDEQILRIWAGW